MILDSGLLFWAILYVSADRFADYFQVLFLTAPTVAELLKIIVGNPAFCFFAGKFLEKR